MTRKIPKPIIEIIQKLEAANFEAFVVGGCVRDLLMNIEPKDWDITTIAKPEDVTKIFPDSFYENKFGTVGIKTNIGVVEVTTYRIESKYSDKRRPDKVKFAKTLEEDLSRRDFTINALALEIKKSDFEIVDLFDGQNDLKHKIMRSVRNANERFDEDALRMMRAVRFAITLDADTSVKRTKGPRKLSKDIPFAIEEKTKKAIIKNAKNLKFIALERIQDELNKILVSDFAAEGIELLRKLKLLQYIIPELEKGYGVGQNRHHIYTIYEHSILSLKNCPSEKLEVRLATLLHDIAKPDTKRGEGAYSTFYNHDHVGARVAEKILHRLKYSNDTIQKVRLLVDHHMFYYNVDEVGESSVRRLVRKVGLENIDDLIDLRVGDRLGSGVPKAVPYKLRHFKYMVDKVSHDPLSVKMLKIDGNDIIKGLKIKPGPIIGGILEVLLSEVLERPEKNKKEILSKRAKELSKKDLKTLRTLAKEKIEERKEEEDQEIKEKYYVK
jgi:tRNA nucleotidyltransferase (CCA-adding enzyme)